CSSTQPDTEDFHGYCMKSMQAIAGKYGGKLKVKAENGVFKLTIWLIDSSRQPAKHSAECRAAGKASCAAATACVQGAPHLSFIPVPVQTGPVQVFFRLCRDFPRRKGRKRPWAGDGRCPGTVDAVRAKNLRLMHGLLFKMDN